MLLQNLRGKPSNHIEHAEIPRTELLVDSDSKRPLDEPKSDDPWMIGPCSSEEQFWSLEMKPEPHPCQICPWSAVVYAE